MGCQFYDDMATISKGGKTTLLLATSWAPICLLSANPTPCPSRLLQNH